MPLTDALLRGLLAAACARLDPADLQDSVLTALLEEMIQLRALADDLAKQRLDRPIVADLIVRARELRRQREVG